MRCEQMCERRLACDVVESHSLTNKKYMSTWSLLTREDDSFFNLQQINYVFIEKIFAPPLKNNNVICNSTLLLDVFYVV